MGLLDPEAAARHLGLAKGTLANWRVRGEGPKFILAGRAVRYDPADLQAWLNGRKVNSTSEPLPRRVA